MVQKSKNGDPHVTKLLAVSELSVRTMMLKFPQIGHFQLRTDKTILTNQRKQVLMSGLI